MASAAATKASDKALACKKLTALLQKDYGKTVPKLKLPVLETMLFAVCLEDNLWEDAEAGYDKLIKSYFDLNEIRVSSVAELERTLSSLRNAEWKGLRIRSILRFVFESTYSFDFEKLSRLTLESAQKRLKKIDYLSPFVSNFTLQQILGSHVVCLDESSHRAAIHLGIVPSDSDIVDASEFLKAGVKKADSFGFSHLLRCIAADPKFIDRFADEYDEEGEFDVLKVADRLTVIKSPRKKRKPKPEPKPAPAKKKAAAASTKKAAPKSSKKAAATKPAAAKSTAKKKTTTTKSKAAPATRNAATKKKTAAPAGKKAATSSKATAKKKGTAASAKAKKAKKKK